MSAINSCVFSGRLVKVPELRTVGSGDKQAEVCDFSLAIDRGYGDKKRTIFPFYQAWRQNAKFICEYGQKGQEVTVICEYDITEDKSDDKKRYHTFKVNDLQLHRGLKDQSEEPAAAPKAPTKNQRKTPPPGSPTDAYPDDYGQDDDLPF